MEHVSCVQVFFWFQTKLQHTALKQNMCASSWFWFLRLQHWLSQRGYRTISTISGKLTLDHSQMLLYASSCLVFITWVGTIIILLWRDNVWGRRDLPKTSEVGHREQQGPLSCLQDLGGIVDYLLLSWPQTAMDWGRWAFLEHVTGRYY